MQQFGLCQAMLLSMCLIALIFYLMICIVIDQRVWSHFTDGYTYQSVFYIDVAVVWCLESIIGGAKRDRTADLLHAMQALSQLSYSPRSVEV
jgi:hypothetical protein